MVVPDTDVPYRSDTDVGEAAGQLDIVGQALTVLTDGTSGPLTVGLQDGGGGMSSPIPVGRSSPIPVDWCLTGVTHLPASCQAS